MKTNNQARKHKSDVVREMLNKIAPVEKMQTSVKMALAARIDDLMLARGFSKSEFAEKMNKNPSEITKWLSGTQNFTIDTLAEIAVTLGIPVSELFAPKQLQSVNKMNIIMNVKQDRPGIFYYTPLGTSVQVPTALRKRVTQ